MWNPFKMLRTKDWLKLQDQDSTFYILVIQDHIESIGKANTIKRGWGVSLWLACSKCLVICSKTLNYLPTFTYDLNQKSNSAPPILSIRRHRVSDVIAIARNPNQFDLTDGISVSPRWACKLSITYCNIFGPTEICNRPHRVCLANSLFHLLPKSVPLSLSNRSNRVLDLP